MNKMKEVAQLLGVELNEKFKIVGKDCKYRITKDGLEVMFYPNSWYPADNKYLVSIIKGTFEIKKPILDMVEKKYLENVIRPFKDRVEYIVKRGDIYKNGSEYITINIKDDDGICLPSFKIGSMYKGMEANKNYTLKELGLFDEHNN